MNFWTLDADNVFYKKQTKSNNYILSLTPNGLNTLCKKPCLQDINRVCKLTENKEYVIVE